MLLGASSLLTLAAFTLGEHNRLSRALHDNEELVGLLQTETKNFDNLKQGIKEAESISNEVNTSIPRGDDVEGNLPRLKSAKDSQSYTAGLCDMKALMTRMRFQISVAQGVINPHDSAKLVRMIEDTPIAFFDDQGNKVKEFTCK